jgi:hypothetical protein
MTRIDLLALTPETIATLTNMGLVRRAQKDIAAGRGPAIDEAADGTVTGRFADGVVTTLSPGVAIAAAICSCRSAAACRHRVAVALAYAAWHGTPPLAAAPPDGDWSPAVFDEDALKAALGARTLARARSARRRGCTIDLRRGGAGRTPEARLATCTVQFLVPRDLAYARCDCAEARGCEHIALAVWAFREAEARQLTGVELTVDLAPEVEGGAAGPPLAAGLAFTREVLLQGAVNVPTALTGQLARAREQLDREGLTWAATILDDLDEQLTAYRNRSARYSSSTVARLLGELAARHLAASRPGELPARYVLGQGEARETLLGHVRLMSLGARVYGGELERWAEVFLADVAAGVVVIAERAWDFAKLREHPADGPALAERSVSPGVTLGALAHGQLVTRAGKRSANRVLRIGSTRRDAFAVSPLTDEWRTLPDSILVRDLARHAAALKARAPRWLRPRVLAETIQIVEIADVLNVIYAPGSQTLVATVVDRRRTPLRLVLRHRAVAPHALSSLAAALQRAPRPQFISGPLYAGDEGLEMIPVGVFTDRVIVPDLAGPTDVALPIGHVDLDAAPLAATLAEAWQALVDGAHAGLLHASSWMDRLTRASQQCDATGCLEISAHLERVRLAVQRLRSGGRDSAPDRLAAAESWERAAIRVALTRERL